MNTVGGADIKLYFYLDIYIYIYLEAEPYIYIYILIYSVRGHLQGEGCIFMKREKGE